MKITIPTHLKISLLLAVIPMIVVAMMLAALFNPLIFGSYSFLYMNQIFAVLYGMSLITIISVIFKIREYMKKEDQ